LISFKNDTSSIYDTIGAMHKIAVVADSHVPDRDKTLNSNLIKKLNDYSPELIIHAGDFITYGIKRKFEAIAPVICAKGNRDILMPTLPHKQFITIDDVKIGVTHGHGTFWSYFIERIKIIFRGPSSFKHFEDIVRHTLAGADVMIYGHSHRPVIHNEEGHLLFNPGSTSFANQFFPYLRTSFGILEIEGSQIKAKIIFLD